LGVNDYTLPVSGSALHPAVQIDHPNPTNNESRSLFACAGASRPMIQRPVCRFTSFIFLDLKIFKSFGRTLKILDKQHADYGQTVTDHYLSGGLWTADFSALPETAYSVAPYNLHPALHRYTLRPASIPCTTRPTLCFQASASVVAPTLVHIPITLITLILIHTVNLKPKILNSEP
jgi:hypothetical protein